MRLQKLDKLLEAHIFYERKMSYFKRFYFVPLNKHNHIMRYRIFYLIHPYVTVNKLIRNRRHKLFNKTVSRLAGWMMLSSYGFLFWGRCAAPDMFCAACATLAVALFAQQEEESGFFHFLLLLLILFPR